MKIAFYFTLACTARCAHCITFAAPRVARKMPLDAARRLLKDVRRTAELDGVVFTGGENFVHRAELLQLVRDCTALGLKSEVISNAYWASSNDAARRMLRPFVEAGLDSLRISIDDYHLPFIPAARVHVALQVMAELGLFRQITCVVPHRATRHRRFQLVDTLPADGFDLEGWDPAAADAFAARSRQQWPPELIELLTRYGFALDELLLVDDAIALRDGESPGGRRLADYFLRTKTLVQYQTLATEGRGRELLAEVELKHVDETADMVCNSVGFTPTVSPEGDVFPCCSSWVNVQTLRSGNLSDMSLATAIDRVRHDSIALFMHHQGPRALIKYLRDIGEDLPAHYSHPCHLCGTALERYSREELTTFIERFYADQPWRMLFTTRGFTPETTALTPFLPKPADAAPPMTLAHARKFFGRLRPRNCSSGLRIEGSVDELVAHLRALGRTADLEPIEDGPPAGAHVAVLRTWGSPWVEILQPHEQPLTGDDLLRELSAHMHRRALQFDYRSADGVWRHRLFKDGRMLETMQVERDVDGVSFTFASEREPAPDLATVRDDPTAYVQEFLSALRIRDWGVSLEDISRGDIPFPPTLMVESFFMRLS
jgi:hypothetical protein